MQLTYGYMDAMGERVIVGDEEVELDSALSQISLVTFSKRATP